MGRLDAEPEENASHYEFFYIEGAREARNAADSLMVPGFPELDAPYQSEKLFPFFENRLMNRRRPERAEYLRGLGLDPARWDPVSELAAPFNHAHGNGFEVYPDVVPDNDGYFQTQFLVHGLRYTNPHSIERTERLEVGEEVRLSLELNNPVTGHAVTVKTADQYVIGWLPRYLVDVVYQGGGWLVGTPEARVAQKNLEGSLSQRVLADLSGQLPPTMRSMDCLPQYRSIDGKEAD